jgi:lysophospholipase L1-like esterase
MSPKPRGRFGFLRDVAISVAVVAVLWAVCEVTLRAVRPQVSHTEWLDGRSRAVPDNLLGHRYRPGARAVQRTPEFTAEYNIDAAGRRAGTSAGGKYGFRVLVLGDSFTFGDGVAAEEVWTAVMERTLRDRRVEILVFNAGVEGYNTRSEAHYLFELEPVLKPDVVVLGFVANDVYTNQPLYVAPSSSVDEHRENGAASHVIALAKRVAMQNDWIYQRLFLVTARKEYYAVPFSPHVTEQLDVTRNLIGAMEAFCRGNGIRFVVVSIPQQFGVIAAARDDRFSGVDPRAIDRDLAAFASTRGFAWIETLEPLAEAYRTTGVDMFYRVDGHLTRDGNRVVGENAADQITPYRARRPRQRP